MFKQQYPAKNAVTKSEQKYWCLVHIIHQELKTFNLLHRQEMCITCYNAAVSKGW